MNEIERLKGFILTIIEYTQLSVTKESLKPILDSNSKSGLRMAAKDMAEVYEDLDSGDILKLDEKLLDKSLPSLTQMYQKSFRDFLKILSKGRITNDDQFRLVNSLVSNIDNSSISDEDRSIAEALMVKYEASK